MQTVGPNLTNILARHPLRGRQLYWLVEVYGPDSIGTGTNQVCDITTAAAPAKAIARWCETCVTWNGYLYESRIFGNIGTIKRFFGKENNSVTITLGNTDLYGTRFVLQQRVEGLYCVIRMVAAGGGSDYAILYTGKFKRPGGINHKTVTLPVQQYFGGLEQEIPDRTYAPTCPLDFGEGDCLGNETLTQKSAAYQNAFAVLGEAGCNKTFAQCRGFGSGTGGPQTRFYQGINLVAVSGSFKYTEKVKTKFLFFFSRTKKVTHTVQYSSSNGENLDEAIGLGWGRVSVGPLHKLQSVDKGTTIESTAAILQGPIQNVVKVAINTQGLTIAPGGVTVHLGNYGGETTQEPDPRFPNSGYFSRLAYVGVTTTGSANEQQDDMPELSAVVLARKVKVPDNDGAIRDRFETTDNPVWNLRDMYTHQDLGRIPECLIDDTVALQTARKCDRLILDATNGDHAVLPNNEIDNPDTNNYRSTGSVIKFLNVELDLNSLDQTGATVPPTTTYYDPNNPPVNGIPQIQILRRRFTLNSVLNQSAKLTDYINRSVLPAARLYVITGANGKLQIKQEDKVDSTYAREDYPVGVSLIPVTNVGPWLLNRTGYVIIGVGTVRAEIAQVKGVRFTPAGNAVPITVTASGAVTATASGATLSGGSYASPASARITLGGVATSGGQVTIKIEDTTVIYNTQGEATLRDLAAILASYINGHPNLSEIVSADWDDTGLTIRSLLGFLELDRVTENSHDEGEENIRVSYVFDNCGGTFRDNILEDSFEWNIDKNNSYNLVKGTFTSAVDRFIRWELRRKAREHIKYVGHENPYDLDLSGVDNYGQAAELTKSKLIELRDADLWFNWKSADGNSFLLEEGEVVAVRHRSGNLTLNYVPLRLREMQFERDTASFVGQLYLTGQYLPDAAPKDPLLPTSVTAGGTSGTVTVYNGAGTGYTNNTDCQYQPGGDYNYGAGYDINGNYSPCGRDIV